MPHPRTVRRAVLLAVAASFAVAPAAGALTSYQGSDYSQDVSSSRQIKAYDGESDGNDVHSDYYLIGSGTLRQVHTDSGAGDIAYSAVHGTKVYRHRAVEEVIGEDPKGPWVYPT